MLKFKLAKTSQTILIAKSPHKLLFEDLKRKSNPYRNKNAPEVDLKQWAKNSINYGN